MDKIKLRWKYRLPWNGFSLCVDQEEGIHVIKVVDLVVVFQ